MDDGIREKLVLPHGPTIPSRGSTIWVGATEDYRTNGVLTYDTIEESLGRWFMLRNSHVPVPILQNHKPLVNFGSVVGFRVERGIGVYALLRPAPDILPLYDAGRIGSVSVDWQANYTDSAGEFFPLVFNEVSFTELPRVGTRGISNEALLAAQLTEVKMTPEEIKKMIDEAVAAMLPAIVQDAVAAAMKPAGELADPPPPAPDPEVEKMKAELSELRTEKALGQKAPGVAIPDAVRNAFVVLYKSDEGAANAMLAEFVSRTATNKGTAVSLPSVGATLSEGSRTQPLADALTPAQIASRASELVAKGTYPDFTTATAAIRKGVI